MNAAFGMIGVVAAGWSLLLVRWTLIDDRRSRSAAIDQLVLSFAPLSGASTAASRPARVRATSAAAAKRRAPAKARR